MSLAGADMVGVRELGYTAAMSEGAS